MTGALVVLLVLVGVLVALAGSSVRVLREYERGVVFRLGRLVDQKGPGLVLLVPVIDRMVRVGLRTVTLNIPPQDVITRDNVTARVNAVAYFHVVDPNRSVVDVEDFLQATSQIAQTTLRSVLGKADLDTLLAERERLNDDLQTIIDQQTEPWGVKVTTVEIKDVEIPASMQHAMARQAEAERNRRAKVIDAEGEAQAATRLADAANIISVNPTTLQLRYLQTLRDIGSNEAATIVFPLPLDLLRPLLGLGVGEGGAAGGTADGTATGPGRAVGAGDGAGPGRAVGAGDGAAPENGLAAAAHAAVGAARAALTGGEDPARGEPAREEPTTGDDDARPAGADAATAAGTSRPAADGGATRR